MRIIIITQKIDKSDPVLGFFHRWIEEFAKRFEFVTVICLEKGIYHLPENVKILSLGKEEGKSKIKYIFRFYKYIWQEISNYESVFVHMNQEYVILGWKLWKVFGKKIYLWRNHAQGSLVTRLAVILSDKVFYTSPQSFTAGFNNAIQMPVGIDTEFFKPDTDIQKIPNSILFLGRIAPVKKVLEFVEWFNTLDEKFQATIAGESLAKDRDYEKLVKKKASRRIKFIGSVTQEEARKLYQSHETYVNMTSAGSMDKTIFEAAACGISLRIDNPDAQNIKIEEHNLKKLMEKLKKEMA